MADEIIDNLVFLTENLTDLYSVLRYMIQNRIISLQEQDEIKAEKTLLEKKYKLLDVIMKKDWPSIRDIFLKILRNTNNDHCADTIEGVSTSRNTTFKHPKVLKSKWWPDKKQLIESLLKRKHGSRLLIEELHDLILKDKNRMAVICESLAASRYSGLGGVGKTVTAKWYSHNYEDFYEHILWMDSGEGSLLQSFKKLARDLNVKQFDKLVDIEDYSRKCYEELKKWHCLWIFDNAESYNKGNEGIIEVLPKYQDNFYCLITSRCRDWGVKNAGMGAISDLQLDIFNDGESLELLQIKLDPEIKKTDDELKKLCRLLGNLPLAMELALAALNSRKTNLKTYIKKISEKDLAFVDQTFDEYETKINKNIKISIDMILEEEDGELANEILMIFGYIRPDDIPEKFIQTIFNSRYLENAIELLIKYSLISKESKNSEINFLSIHRLQQQVIRYNCRIPLIPSSKGTISNQSETTEKTILRKIFGCEGFTDLKLIPFVKHADDKLRNEFPRLKAELLDQEHLKKLIKEESFEEAVELAKYIDKQLKTKTTKFNYAVCLDKNGNLGETVAILEKLGKEKMKEEGNHAHNVQMGILLLEKKVSRDLIHGHLIILYRKLGHKMRIQELLATRKKFQIINSNESLDILIRIIYSDLIQSNYSLVKKYSTITFQLGTESMKIQLRYCSLNLSSFDRLSPTELSLEDVSFNRGGQKLEEVAVTEFIDLDKIDRLTLKYDLNDTKMCIDLSGDVSLEYLHLNNIRVLGWKDSQWNIQILQIWGIPFVEQTKITIKELRILDSSLDISCLPGSIQKLDLGRVEVVCSGEIDLPNLNYLALWTMSKYSVLSFFHSLNITHIHFIDIEEVNLDLLPKSVTHFKITCNKTIVLVGVRRVDKLILECFSFLKTEDLLSHFQADVIVIEYHFKPKELIELTKKVITRIAVGEVDWGKEDFSILSNYVDRKADFYLWEEGRGRGIEKEEFEELKKLH